eukprot:1492211-Rhodomonas_salina.1
MSLFRRSPPLTLSSLFPSFPPSHAHSLDALCYAPGCLLSISEPTLFVRRGAMVVRSLSTCPARFTPFEALSSWSCATCNLVLQRHPPVPGVRQR